MLDFCHTRTVLRLELKVCGPDSNSDAVDSVSDLDSDIVDSTTSLAASTSSLNFRPGPINNVDRRKRMI